MVNAALQIDRVLEEIRLRPACLEIDRVLREVSWTANASLEIVQIWSTLSKLLGPTSEIEAGGLRDIEADLEI